MTTWGPSKKQTAKSRRPASSSRPAGTRGKAAGPARSGSDDTTQVAPATRPRGAVSSATPPSGGSRREQTTDELRRAVGGREHEFLGHRADRRRRAARPGASTSTWPVPLGRGHRDRSFGWLAGDRPLRDPRSSLVAGGVSLVRKGSVGSSPSRLAIGWGARRCRCVIGIAARRQPVRRGFGSTSTAVGTGPAVAGSARWARERRSRRCSHAAGAVVVAARRRASAGALLVTQTSLRTMATRTGQGVGNVARPMARAARQALRDLSSLSSDREDRDGEIIDATIVQGEPRLLPPPTVYDAADDFDERPPPRRRKPRQVAAGPAAALPPSDGATVGSVDAAAELVPHAHRLADHQQGRGRGARSHAGRVARLARRRDQAARQDRRPHRHPLRARARLRRQGRPHHQPATRHRLRDGGHRRAHPGARSPGARRSASRCPTTPASWSRSATS